jgi:hypothetical protein
LRIFYELFQEYKQQLLNQISQRVQAKQQQKQHDSVLYQKSLYGTAALQPEPISSSVLRVDAPPTHPASHRLPFGVRSFLDPGNREPQAALLILLRSVVVWLLTGAAGAGSQKTMRQEYGAELKKQMQIQQVLKSQRGKA